MPSRIFGSLSMHSTSMSASWPTSTRCGSRARASRGSAGASGTSTEKCEPRPGFECSSTGGRARARCARRSRGRGRGRAPPWRPGRAGGTRGRSRASSTAECRARCRRRRCAAGRRARRQPTSTRPCGVYLIAFETRFCSSRRNSRRSERTARVLGTKVEREALLARERRELDLELAHQLVDAEAGDLRPHRAGIEPRDVEQRAEDFLHRLERGIDVARRGARPRRCPGARPGW